MWFNRTLGDIWTAFLMKTFFPQLTNKLHQFGCPMQSSLSQLVSDKPSVCWSAWDLESFMNLPVLNTPQVISLKVSCSYKLCREKYNNTAGPTKFDLISHCSKRWLPSQTLILLNLASKASNETYWVLYDADKIRRIITFPCKEGNSWANNQLNTWRGPEENIGLPELSVDIGRSRYIGIGVRVLWYAPTLQCFGVFWVGKNAATSNLKWLNLCRPSSSSQGLLFVN